MVMNGPPEGGDASGSTGSLRKISGIWNRFETSYFQSKFGFF